MRGFFSPEVTLRAMPGANQKHRALQKRSSENTAISGGFSVGGVLGNEARSYKVPPCKILIG